MLNLKAKKHFGQNFLKDTFYIDKIIESVSKLVESLNISDLKIVEVGAGLGDLSAGLLNHFDLIAYEIDSELCRYLEDKFPKDRFRLHNCDVLAIPRDGFWLCEKPYVLVSNLPYYVATKIILTALKDAQCKGLVVMAQKEVADKFCAKVNEREFCALSVLAQSVSQKIQRVIAVPPSAFNPPPKVDSSVFAIAKNECILSAEFEAFLRLAFCAPRKKLAKNLSKLKGIEHILTTLNIPESARAHQITTEQYHKIFNLGENNG